jgi:excisionase family DNA binding protein
MSSPSSNTTLVKGRDPDLISIPEAADLLGISPETAYRLARRDPCELPGARQIGRSWRVSRPKLLAHFHGDDN